MGLLIPLVFIGCAEIQRYKTIDQPTDVPLFAEVGGVVLKIRKTRDLPNAFGRADLWGGKVDEGVTELRYLGLLPDGALSFRLADLDISSDDDVYSRYLGRRYASKVVLPHAVTELKYDPSQESGFIVANTKISILEVTPTRIQYVVHPTASERSPGPAVKEPTDQSGVRKPELVKTQISPVLMPPLIHSAVHNLAIVPLSDTTQYPKVSAWLDLALGFLRTRHPEIILAEREALASITREVTLQHSGRVDDHAMVSAGKMTGADTLLAYRVDPLSVDGLSVISRNGGVLQGALEFRVVSVEKAVTLFRQAATSTVTLARPESGKVWSELSIRLAHRMAVEAAASYVLAALVAAFGDNPLGIIPDLTGSEQSVGLFGVLQGGPAHVAGLKKGDRLLAVNGQPIPTWTIPIRLPATLTIERDGQRQEVSVPN